MERCFRGLSEIPLSGIINRIWFKHLLESVALCLLESRITISRKGLVPVDSLPPINLTKARMSSRTC
jgi:hypothetical protein